LPRDFLKLRLRGKGSLHKEGNKKRECNDRLHLCVSAKEKLVLELAIVHIEKLLDKLKNDYLNFCKQRRVAFNNKLYIKV